MEKKRFRYRIYDIVLESDIEYPQLIPADGGTEAEALIREVAVIAGDSEEDCSNQVFEVNKKRIHFANRKGSFIITDGKLIELRPKKRVPMEELTPFVFGYCMAMLFWQRGKLAIHCSAIEMNGKALIICGGSGAGKSTLTAKLIENGARLMTDDVAVVDFSTEDAVIVHPAFPQQKLCRDAVVRNRMDTGELLYIDEDKDKFAVSRKETFCDRATKLVGIIALNRYGGDTVVMQELQGQASLMAILDNLFMKPVFEASCAFPPEDMMKCIKIAQTVPVFKVLRPMEGDSTAEQVRLIKERVLQ